MDFSNEWVQAVLTVGVLLLVWMGVFALFAVVFAVTGEHIRRQRTDDPDDDWYK